MTASTPDSAPPSHDVPPAERLSFDPPANDPDITGYDVQRPWWSLWNRLTSRTTPLGISLAVHDRSVAMEARDCARCDAQVAYLMAYSPMIRFLRGKLHDLNGDVDPARVFCRRCPVLWTEAGEARHKAAAGVSMAHGVQICANLVRRRAEVETVLAHELVHAWDGLRWQFKDDDLRHAACTEIRASALSGECRWWREFRYAGNLKITQQHQDCVRRRAIQSVRGRPFCRDDEQARKVVDEVWDACYADTRPFDEIYK